MINSTSFFFIFGRNPKLSLAELLSYLSTRSIDVDPVFTGVNFLILNIHSKFNPKQAANDLAGMVKIGRVYITTIISEDAYTHIQNSNFYIEDSKNLNYSISTYGNRVDEAHFSGIFKRIFKENKQKATLKKPNPSGLWNALQKKNFVDIVICNSKTHCFIGRTIASYNINDNKKRYEKRPFVDESIGSSVRFSRILVNLSQVKTARLLDPFCGIGTVLQEGLLLGFDVVGSELEKERVKHSKENLKWIKHVYHLTSSTFDVIQSDVRKLHEKLPKESIDTVVTEPELGPFLKSTPNYNEAQSILRSLEDLYSSTFKVINTILKPKGTFVIVLPQFITSNHKKIHSNIQFLTANTQLIPIPEVSHSNISIKFPIYYKEKWHRLGRLIYLFRKL